MDGIACLAVRRAGVLSTVVLAGHGPSDYGRLPARDGEVAAELAAAIVRWLASVRGPWRLELAQLPVGDPVAAAMIRLLPRTRIRPDQASPELPLGSDRDAEQLFPTKVRREVRRGYTRLAREGLTAEIRRAADGPRVRELLPEIVQMHRSRDHALGRRSDLDNPRRRRFYVEVLGALADRGQVDISTLRVDGTLAAFFVGVRDARSYRILDGRMSADWGSISPALLLRVELITQLARDPTIASIDYMRGVLHHKMQDATRVVPSERLRAESSPLVGLAVRMCALVRETARAWLPGEVRRYVLGRFTAPAVPSRPSRAESDAGPAAPPPPA